MVLNGANQGLIAGFAGEALAAVAIAERYHLADLIAERAGLPHRCRVGRGKVVEAGLLAGKRFLAGGAPIDEEAPEAALRLRRGRLRRRWRGLRHGLADGRNQEQN